MPESVLESYLIKIGASVDGSSFTKFNNTLGDAAKLFDFTALGVVKDFARIDATIVGAFASVGAGLIGLADKTAMADQSYRLFGQQMLMTEPVARVLSTTLDELGVSMDQVLNDTTGELQGRFKALYDQNQKLVDSLGPDFEKNMVGIRSMRMEYEKFGVELGILKDKAVSQLYEKLGFSSGETQQKLEGLNDWFTTKLPGWSDQISTGLIPVWNDANTVVTDFGSILKKAAGEFILLTGDIMDDKSLQTQEVSVRNVIKAFDEWIDTIADVALSLQLVEKMALHVGASIGDEFGAMTAWLHGDKDQAKKLQAEGHAEDLAFNADVKSIGTGTWEGNADFSGLLRQEANEAKEDEGPDPTLNLNGAAVTRRHGPASTAQTVAVPDNLKAALVNPDFMKLMHGIAMTESGDKQFDENGKPVLGQPNATGEIAVGRYQLLPSTAAHYGIDPNDDKQNTLGAEMYVRDLLNEHHGDLRATLADYGGFKTASPDDYVAKVERYAYQSGYVPPSATTVTINVAAINVPPNTSPADVTRYLTDSMRNVMGTHLEKVNQRTTAQTAGGPHF